MTDESFWPARNVAEYAYCPRLFYLMEVEGVFVPNADTAKGIAVHRRVDRPSEMGPESSDAPADPDRPEKVRSLTLSSPGLGLTATLDLAEIAGNTAVPVEYRKGKPRRIAASQAQVGSTSDSGSDASLPEPWPTDRVQVALQSVLLEEAGYCVPRAVIYYAAEKLRLDVPMDDTLKSEAMAILQAAKTCAAGERPMPLVNDARCMRCSLQPICLPDEVNQQQSPEYAASPRSIWPLRDDGIHVVAQVSGSKVGVRGLSLTLVDSDGKKLKDIPLANVESLALLGSVQISTQAVGVLADRGIPIAFLSAAGRLLAMIDPVDSVSASVRKAQMLRFDQPAICLELCRALVASKIINQRTLLLRNHSALPNGIAEDLATQAEAATHADSIESLRGHEGQAAAIYFKHFAGMFKDNLAGEFDANGRQRRPPPDPINACLSLAYSMLTHECVAALRLASLEPSVGAFHVSRPGRPALALDLMEPFRPLIADSVAVMAFNRGELTEGHFTRTSAGCLLSDAGRRAFFGVYGRRMDTEITHPVFGYKLSYRRMLVLHARMIAAWLLGEVPTLSFLTTR